MADTTTNFFINSSYNPNFDITWSFQYNISGSNDATGGFSTFLFNSPALSGGGTYSGVGYAPYQNKSGVTGAVLGIIFDTNNNITVKYSTTFTTLTTIPLFTELKPFINNEKFNTIRFNLTNLGKILNIAVKNPENNKYKTLCKIDTGILINDTNLYKIGFGYSSPLNSSDKKIAFRIKDIHIQGSSNKTTTKICVPPYIFVTSTYYILQSPESDKIQIGLPDPIVDGYLMHK